MAESKSGFLYEPSTEDEVVLLFGLLMPHIGEFLKELGLGSRLFVDEWTENPTDCVIWVDGREVRVEFELYSSNSIGRHDPEKCDLIVCWINNWENPPQNIKILELRAVCKRIAADRGLRFIVEDKPKYPERKVPYTLEEFEETLKSKLDEQDFNILWGFIEELRRLDGVQLQTGIGEKIPTLGIGFRKYGCFPLGIGADGKAYIAYYNVNVKPPKPLLPPELRERIWMLLGAPKTKNGEAKKWHYIKAPNTTELVKKLKHVVDVLLKV